MLFSQFIKIECAKRNITLKEFCNEADIDYNTFASAYKVRPINAKTLLKIARYFGVPLEDLVEMEVK